MKLSEKGIAKVNGAMVVVRDYSPVGVPIQVIRGANRIEFEAEDFTGAVVLTVEEAKKLAIKLKHNAEFFFLQTGEFNYDTNDLWECLAEKIEMVTTPNINKINGLDVKTKDLPTTPKEVRFTVEEAKEFEEMIYDFLETFESQFKDTSEWNYYVLLHHLLEKRIEYAEKCE